MQKTYKRKLCNIGGCYGIYIPMPFIKKLNLQNKTVSIKLQNTEFIIEEYLKVTPKVFGAFYKTINKTGTSYRILLPKEIDRLNCFKFQKKFKIMLSGNKIIIKGAYIKWIDKLTVRDLVNL